MPSVMPGDSATARDPLLRRALGLLGLTILYAVAEGIIAVWFGAKEGSTSLLAFGIDSGPERAASGVLLWRMAVEMRDVDAARAEAAERRARRLVGVTFFGGGVLRSRR